MRRIAKGDESALAALYDRWIQPVYSLIVSLLRSADEAEDVTEETFWQVWQRAGAFDPSRETVRTWLLTIARSRALGHLRSHRRHPAQALDGDAFVVALADSDPLLEASEAQRRARVLAALRAVPDDQRQAMTLAYFHGLSQHEIAELLGCPPATVQTGMRLGLRELREQLALRHTEGA